MNKRKRLLAALLLGLSILGGCSMDDKKAEDEIKDSAPVKDSEKALEDGKEAVEDSMENMVSFFKEKKVSVDNMQTLKDMEFAAEEGRSFSVDGKNAYLYRIKHDDEQMNKVMKEAKEKGKVKVSITGKEMEYNARVNGDFLLLYDPAADMEDVVSAFDAYKMKNVNTSTAENNFDDTSGNVDASAGNNAASTK